MNKPALMACIGIILLVCSSCGEKTTKPDTKPDVMFSSQSSKCLKGLTKKDLNDSNFVYTFSDTLTIDFSVQANCCPDSDRFSLSWISAHDTINVTVRDTAQEGCYCICPYLIHATFGNLPNDHYVVQCMIDNAYNGTNPIYLVDVYRTK